MTPRTAAALAVAAGLALGPPAAACTTAVVSGRATPDGRPLLWKNRDTKEVHNRVVYVPAGDGTHAYLAVVTAGSASVWMGVNERGFCIENSLVKDMPRGGSGGTGNGGFMRHALSHCASVKEFEALLQTTNGGRSTRATFGVIDGDGGAAVFEAGHTSFARFDANDAAVAPDGYVVRSNFTMTGTGAAKLADGGDLRDVYAGERYLRADALFRRAAREKAVDHRFVLRNCSRDLADRAGRPYPGSVNGCPGPLPPAVDTDATLSRRTTVSAAVFCGVRAGEDPALTTMWVMLGEPTFAAAVPCWVKAGGAAPALTGQKLSPLCTATIALRNACYDGARRRLQTAHLPDVWARTWALEDAVLRETDGRLARWRAAAPGRDEVLAFHRARADQVAGLVERLRTTYAPAAVGAAAGGK